MKKEIVIFEADNLKLEVPFTPEQETVWLNRNQMAELFGRDIKTIGKHINNALREELNDNEIVAKFATTTQHGAIEGKTQTHMTEYYNLDMIISVGYRVKSKRDVEFRLCANGVLKDYIIKGYAVNDDRMDQLKKVIINCLKRS
jgi:Virulence protein